MRTHYRLLIVASIFVTASITLLTAQQAQPEGIPTDLYERAPADVKKSKAFLREKWFYERRGYPNHFIPSDARQQAIAQAKAMQSPFAKRDASKLFRFSDWQLLGPIPGQFGSWGDISGRIPAIALDPKNANRIYVGGADGGVWRSDNKGITWMALTDHEPSMATGSIAIDPTNSNVVYVGTGEATYSGTSYYGNGVLKSVDGGYSWKHLRNGLPANAHTSRILVSAKNPSIVILALATRGIYRSTNGGDTWIRTFGTKTDDIVFHPQDNSIIYGVGGDGTGMIRSTNDGASWSSYGTGLPGAKRIHFDLCASQPSSMYAAAYIEQNAAKEKVKLFRSTNGGLNWTPSGATVDFKGGQAWYDFYLRASWQNPLVCFVGTIEIFRTTDGGVSWMEVSKGYSGGPVHVDQHEMRFDPVNSQTIYAGCDGGIYKSTDLGNTWGSLNSNLAMTQFYRIAANPNQEMHVIGGTQDNGTQQSRGTTKWTLAFGGDGMEVCFARKASQFMMGESQNGGINYSTDAGYTWKSALDDIREKSNGEKEDAEWVAPIISHPNGTATFYHGRRNVYKSTNGGKNWAVIADTVFSDVIHEMAIGNNITAPYLYCTSGSKIARSTDGGATFVNIASGLPGRTITSIYTHPSPDSQQVVFVTLADFGGDNVWRRNYTNTGWMSVSGNLPDIPANDIFIHPDFPEQFWVVATDIGVYATEDGGRTWGQLSSGLPNCVVQHLDYHDGSKKLRAGTHGRSVWEMTLAPKVILPPKNLVATAGMRQVTVTWEASPSTGVINYSVYRGMKTGMGEHVGNVGTNLAILNTWLDNNKTYFYRVRAVTTTDSSEFSAEVSATPFIWQGCIGKVASFTLSGHHIVLPNTLNGYAALTVEGWVWWKAFKTWSRFIDLGSRDHSFLVANEAQTGTLSFQVFGPAGSNEIKVGQVLRTDRPVHIAAVSGPNGMRLYVDGQLMDSHPYTGSLAQTGATAFTNYIGRSNWTTDLNFNGEMDEIRIWKAERTEDQIRGDFNRALTPTEIADTNLIAYYNFENVSGTTVIDASTKKNNAELKQGLPIINCSTPVSVGDDKITPLSFQLRQNNPNPFYPTTNISFSLDRTASVSLHVFNALGEIVASLIKDESMEPGEYVHGFDASNLHNGVYYYTLRAGERSMTRKMMLVR